MFHVRLRYANDRYIYLSPSDTVEGEINHSPRLSDSEPFQTIEEAFVWMGLVVTDLLKRSLAGVEWYAQEYGRIELITDVKDSELKFVLSSFPIPVVMGKLGVRPQ